VSHKVTHFTYIALSEEAPQHVRTVVAKGGPVEVLLVERVAAVLGLGARVLARVQVHLVAKEAGGRSGGRGGGHLVTGRGRPVVVLARNGD
jgi:hypothetical protein